MANPRFHAPHPQNHPTQRVEVAPQTDGVPLQNVHQPDANRVDSYLGVDHNYGQLGQYYNHAPAPHQVAPPATENLDGRYTYPRNPNIDYSTLGDVPANLVASGSVHVDHNLPPAHDILNGDERPPLMPDSANSFSQSVPFSPPSGALAMENLRHIADRYLQDPGSRIDTLRIGLSPSGGRLRVTIIFDMEV